MPVKAQRRANSDGAERTTETISFKNSRALCFSLPSIELVGFTDVGDFEFSSLFPPRTQAERPHIPVELLHTRRARTRIPRGLFRIPPVRKSGQCLPGQSNPDECEYECAHRSFVAHRALAD